MALKKVRFSDVTDRQIEDGSGAVVRIELDNVPSEVLILDVNQAEIEELILKARRSPRRGRPRKS